MPTLEPDEEEPIPGPEFIRPQTPAEAPPPDVPPEIPPPGPDVIVPSSPPEDPSPQEARAG